VGDWVYVKLQPYAQHSVQRRTNNKLSYKYFGPYLILQKIGQVAYKLQLPAASQIHPVLHVSQLKKALPPEAKLSTYEDLQLLSILETLPPAQVLAQRLHLISDHVVPSMLVQRESCPVHWPPVLLLLLSRRCCPRLRLQLHREDAMQLKERGMSQTGPSWSVTLGYHINWAHKTAYKPQECTPSVRKRRQSAIPMQS